MSYRGALMTKSVEQQALEFVENLAAYPDDKYAPFTLNDVVASAQLIVEQMCKHSSVAHKQYCQLCGWHNVPTKRGRHKCDHKNTHLQSGVCLQCGKETK